MLPHTNALSFLINIQFQTNQILRRADSDKFRFMFDDNSIQTLADSALGQLKGSDSIFEIYTESYGENPIVIMGAGAGAKVTARGVFGDILRLSENK